MRRHQTCDGDEYYTNLKRESRHNRVYERSVACLDLDAVDGQLLLLTVCIAEVQEFEKRLPWFVMLIKGRNYQISCKVNSGMERHHN